MACLSVLRLMDIDQERRGLLAIEHEVLTGAV
jgi:hypothetical protein